jgi:peptide/nickel transport system substrate-binding protein
MTPPIQRPTPQPTLQEKTMKTPLLFAACALAAALAPAAVRAQAETLLRVAMNSDIRGTNPGVNRDSNTDTVIQHIVEGLVAHREDGSVGPLLASAVDVSKDGLVYTFRLRTDVKFHNGAPLTAADVVWSWKRYLDPATGWQCASSFDGRGRSRIDDIAAKDAGTVVFRISAPNALFLAEMASIQCGGGAILHRDSLNPDGTWKAPVSTGPFTIREWRRGQYLELAKYPGYSALPGQRDGYTGNKTPLVDAVRFVFIPEESVAKAALQRGDVDVLPYLTRESRADLEKRAGFVVGGHPTNSTTTLLLQTRDPLLKDVRVRRAIAMAIDGPQLVKVVTGDTGPFNQSVVARTSAFYGAAQRQGYKPDIDRARALLKEAGYNGEPIKLVTNKRYADMYNAALVAQAMARRVGLNLEIEVLEWATQLDRYTKGQYQMMSFGYSSRLDPSLAFESMAGPKDKQPRKVWDNPQAQALLEKSFVEADAARRQALFDELHRMMIDDVPLVMLFNSVDEYAHSQRVSGYKSWAAGKERLWGVQLAPGK